MNKRKIILTALIGATALSTLSATLTMAWYSSSDRLKINSFEIDMSGNVQLLISTSKEIDTFKQELTKDELVEKEFLFSPVSSMNQSNWFDQKGDTPLFYDSSSPALDGVISEEEATTGFFQKRVYLLSNLVNYYATLDISKCVFDSNEESNALRAETLHKQYPDVSVEDITTSLNSLRDCLRMSILVNTEDYYRYYIVDPYKDESEVYFGGVLDNDGDGYYDVYTDEQGHKREVVYGEIEDRSKVAYDAPVNPDGDVELLENKGSFYGNSFEAKNRIDAYTFNKESSSDIKIATEKSYTLDEIDSFNTELLIPCYKGEPTEVVISVYLEGWDKACINQTMGACFDANICFKLLRRIA